MHTIYAYGYYIWIRSKHTTYPHTIIKDFAKQRYNTPYACNVI